MASTEEQENIQKNFEKHASEFNVNLKFPANVTSKDTQKPLRTNTDLIQIRLLEAGVSYEASQPVSHLADRLSDFVSNLEQSGCYETVQVEVDTIKDPSAAAASDGSVPAQELNVFLKEKNWYRLYVGGGLRNDMQMESGQGGNLLAKTQFETTAGLTNLTGHLDTTALQYTVDATSNSRWDFQHIRPLDSVAPGLLQYIDVGTYALGVYAALDSVDYEWTRSYKERQRKLSLRVSNHGQVRNPEMANTPYIGCEWSWLFRDILPRRHATLPYALDSSPEIASQSGPSEKNSLTFEHRTNGAFCDSKFNPTDGIDYYSKVEVAGPPGDVGFVKAQGGGSIHIPILPRYLSCSLHGSLHTGILQSLSFGGACKPATVSDRFHVGGPLQLRGFCPAGIGPRAKTGSTTAPQGDALGGEFFYTATMAASMTTANLDKYGVRFLAFGNMGSLTGAIASAPSWSAIANSSRASLGLGVSAGLPMGRVEATYAWPLLYGPRDVRKNVQFGLGFSFG